MYQISFSLLFTVFSAFVSVATATDSYGGHGDSYGGGGHGDSYGGGGHGGYGGHGYGHSVDAAVNSKHSVDTYSVKTNSNHAKTPVVDINSGPLSLKIRFNSHSSNIHAVQNHYGSHGQVKKSHFVDHPDILIHSVKKPIIQEIKEVITPYRKRIQEVKPVQEKVETIIATGHGGYGGHGYGGHGYGHGGGHGYGGHGGGHGYGHKY